MPLRMRRKARGMEKVENLYCTARAQHVMPPCMDHADESGGANRFKPSRPSGPASASGMSEVKANRGARRLGTESTLAADEACAIPSAIRVVEKWDAGRPPAAAMQDWPSGHQPLSIFAVPCLSVSLAHPLSDMSQFAAELCEYCADIAPIVPSLHGIPQSLRPIRPSFLRCSAPRLRVPRSHQKESWNPVLTTFARR